MSFFSPHHKSFWRNGTFWLFWVFPVIYTCFFVVASLVQLYIFDVNDWDFSYFSVLFWNIAEGHGYFVPFHDEQKGLPFYTHHWVPGAAFFAPFMYFFPSPYTLSVIHALVVGSVFFLLPRLVRCIFAEHGHNDWAAAASFVQLFAFFYIPFLAAWRYQSHLTTLVMPVILLAIWALHRNKPLLTCLCCLFLALGQERSAVAVFGVGMYAIFLLRHYKLGLGLCFFSSLYFVAAIKIMEWLRHGVDYAFSDAIVPFSFLKEKARFLLTFFVYTAFIPLLGRKAFLSALCALPVIAIGLVSNRPAMYNFIFHYHDLASMFALVSVIYGCLFVKEHAVKIRPYIATLTLVFVAYCTLFAAPKNPHPLGVLLLDLPGENLVETTQLHADVKKLLQLSQNVSLRVQSGLGPMVSVREKRYCLSESDLKRNFSHEIIAISPLAGIYSLSSYENTRKQLNANPSLTRIADTGRLQVYMTKDLSLTWK